MTSSSNPLNTNEWAFPVCEILHILGFAIAIGTITMVDLRLLGIGLKKETAADLWKGTFAWTLAGLALVLITGPLIFSSDPNMYLRNASLPVQDHDAGAGDHLQLHDPPLGGVKESPGRPGGPDGRGLAGLMGRA